MRWVKLISLPVALACVAALVIFAAVSNYSAAGNEERRIFVGVPPVVNAAVGQGSVAALLSAGAQGSDSNRQEVDETVKALRADIARLEQSQLALQQSVRELLAREIDATGENLVAPAEPQSPSLQDGVGFAESIRIELEDNFVAEADDENWATWATEALRDGFSADAPEGMELVDAECRATVCRLEMTLDELQAGPETLAILPLLMPWDGESHLSVDPDTGRTVVYMAREGVSLIGDTLNTAADER
ncbi:MAG: hypothetical protein K0U93_21910 [Gammaproteobacteria bacterium]|nr:hypothetical protein [Gammaproteobacteria bacterium]